MNGVEHIVKAFGRGIDKLAGVFGNWGSSQPLDDSKSGIVMNGKIYQVVVSMNGCYWYLDENGKKQSIAQIPNTVEWEWVNIAEKVLKDFRTCYRLKTEIEKYNVIESTIEYYSAGSVMNSIPDDFIKINCKCNCGGL